MISSRLLYHSSVLEEKVSHLFSLLSIGEGFGAPNPTSRNTLIFKIRIKKKNQLEKVVFEWSQVFFAPGTDLDALAQPVWEFSLPQL